jgi:Flp pilus assembly protein CpaB
MRRGRIFFYLAFILILGLAAFAVIWLRFLKPASTSIVEATPAPVVEMVEVVVVTQHVPRGSILNETVLGKIEIPRNLFIEGYFTDLAQVVGRQAKLDLEANMLLTTSMVVDNANQLSATGSVAALSIPKGMVAVSIPIKRLSSVSYAPQPGDHVNVILSIMLVDLDVDNQTILPNHVATIIGPGPVSENGPSTLTAKVEAAGEGSFLGKSEIDPLLEQTFYSVPSEVQRPRLVSQSLLQDAVVLGLGDFPREDKPVEQPAQADVVPATEEPPVEPAPEGQPEEISLLPVTITLIVTPQDAVTLNYLMMIFPGAQLTLALRSAGDDTRVQTEAVTLDFLLKQYNIPVPLKLPYGLEPRLGELALPELPNDAEPTPTP